MYKRNRFGFCWFKHQAAPHHQTRKFIEDQEDSEMSFVLSWDFASACFVDHTQANGVCLAPGERWLCIAP